MPGSELLNSVAVDTQATSKGVRENLGAAHQLESALAAAGGVALNSLVLLPYSVIAAINSLSRSSSYVWGYETEDCLLPFEVVYARLLGFHSAFLVGSVSLASLCVLLLNPVTCTPGIVPE